MCDMIAKVIGLGCGIAVLLFCIISDCISCWRRHRHNKNRGNT